jgi:DNA-binding LacI/PurR family transcriptional regulator
MKKGITIKDIAKKLNMSVSTVSKALNNDPTISTLTKERVHQLAKDLHYVPNEAARNFKLNKSFTIGIIIPNLIDQFFILAINGVEAIAEKENYNVILAQSHEDVSKEEKITNVMIRNRVDGVIVTITKNTVDMLLFENLMAMGIPVVFIAREPASPAFSYVLSDNVEGGFKATNFLIEKGHHRIAHIMAPQAMLTSQMRLQGYKNALVKNNLPIDNRLIKEVDFSTESIANAMKELMELSSPPTAIFVFKTYIIFDAIDFLKKNYSAEADKMDFVGFGNLPLLKYLDHKPIASIEESSRHMGEEAARLLFKMINEPSEDQEPQRIEVASQLVVHT